MPVGRPARHTPDELLALVTAVFIEQGYDATSMEDIARATGMTKSAIYHHVSSKEDLLRRAVARGLEAMAAVLEDTTDGRAVDRLEQVVRRSAGVVTGELPYVTLLLRVRGNTAAERWALSRRREIDQQLVALVQQAVDDGDLRADLEPGLVTKLLFGMLNSVTEWYRPGGPDLADAVVALAFDGLRTA